MSKVMTPTEFAGEVGSTGREVRKFLRSITPRDEQPGKGSRWSLPGTKRDITALAKKFDAWKTAQDEARAAREAAAAEAEENEVDDSEELELDDDE